MVDAEYYRELLRPMFRGRKLVLFIPVLAGIVEMIASLRSLGAERCLVIASSLGTGPIPDEADAEHLVLGLHARDPIDEFRQMERVLENPPEEVWAAIDRYDPRCEAVVVLPAITLAPGPTSVAGRPVWGRRLKETVALEDKVVIDDFWDACGINRAPSSIVRPAAQALVDAMRRLDRGLGVACAGDAREGIHGGAHLFRWIRSEDGLAEAEQFLRTHCDRVRMMPFLEGIPCSIHGIVFEDVVIAIRPVEMVTLRYAERAGLRYCGAATFWDPPADDRDYMRSLARRVGRELRERIGFRGAFTIDGVMTEDGFLPTEMNPRFGAGLTVIARGLDLSLGLLNLALVERKPFDYRPADLEGILVTEADRQRSGGGWTWVESRQEGNQEHRLAFADGRYQLARERAHEAVLLLGPSGVGGFLRFTPEPGHIPVGSSVAPWVVAAFAFADANLGTGLGQFEAAREVRR